MFSLVHVVPTKDKDLLSLDNDLPITDIWLGFLVLSFILISGCHITYNIPIQVYKNWAEWHKIMIKFESVEHVPLCVFLDTNRIFFAVDAMFEIVGDYF